MTFNFIHFPVTDQPQPDFFISGPTKRPARGRENDLIGLLLYFHGRQGVSADELRQWHERLSTEYFRTSGSVTAAMKAVVEAAGKQLFQANDPFGDESNWRSADLTLLVIHHDVLFVCQAGQARVILIREDTRSLLFDPELDQRPLGAASLSKPRFFQSDLAEGDCLVAGRDLPSAWTMVTLRRMEVPMIWQTLYQAEPYHGSVVLLQITAGSGKAPASPLGTPAATPEPGSNAEPALAAAEPPTGQEAVDGKPGGQDDQAEASPSEETRSTLAEDLFGHLPVAPILLPDEGAAAPLPVQPPARVAESSKEALEETQSAQLEGQAAREEPQSTQREAEPRWQEPSQQEQTQAIRKEEQAETPEISPETARIRTRRASQNGQSHSEAAANAIGQGMLKGVASGAGWLRGVEDKVSQTMDAPRGSEGLGGEQPAALSPSLKLIIALLVPLLVVGLATLLFNSRGVEDQYLSLLEQARAAAVSAAQAPGQVSQQAGWEETLALLQQAAEFGVTDEWRALQAQALSALDALEGAQRLVYTPAYAAEMFPTLDIRQIVPLNNDVYLLDATSGSVLRMVSSGGSYQADPDFTCGPGYYGGVQVGALVDVMLIPLNNPAKVPLLGLDGSGNLIYCGANKTPTAVSLSAPAVGWGKLQAATFDSGRLFILDPQNNALWIYRGFSSQFDQPADSYFEQTPVHLETAVDVAVSGDEMFILYGDGHASHCLASNVTGGLECADPYLYQDVRNAAESQGFSTKAFSRLAYSPPPDPSIYFLEPQEAALYQFSLRLSLNKILRASSTSGVLPQRAVSAFAVTPSRRVFLAFQQELYVAMLP